MICRKCRQEKSLEELAKNIKGDRICAAGCKWQKRSQPKQKEIKEEKPEYEFANLSSTETTKPFRVVPKASRYIVTCAVSNAPASLPFLRSLETYANYQGAEIVVIPVRYKVESGEDYAWDSVLAPYFSNAQMDPNNNVRIMGELNIRPTASQPLSGIDGMGGHRSLIVAHPKVSLKCVPTPHKRLPKILTTTGAVTTPNYREKTKAGYLGEFHHQLAATILEVDKDIFHIRQVHFNGRGFYDLDRFYDADGTVTASGIDALVLGDAHVGFFCPDVFRATFADADSIAKRLKPKIYAWHDLLDFYNRNHHHRGNPFNAIAKHKEGMGDVRAEIESTAEFLETVNNLHPAKHIIVGSNHNDALTRWIFEADWKNDPVNAEFYLETALYMTRQTEMTECGTKFPNPYRYWLTSLTKHLDIQVLSRDESYTVGHNELGHHGDIGSNGSRGSIRQFGRAGAQFIIGHSHSPGIFEGTYQTGTSTHLRLEYTKGLSSWLNTHCIVYPDGKRCLINVIDGKYTVGI